jgi:hypothetical protein
MVRQLVGVVGKVGAKTNKGSAPHEDSSDDADGTASPAVSPAKKAATTPNVLGEIGGALQQSSSNTTPSLIAPAGERKSRGRGTKSDSL